MQIRVASPYRKVLDLKHRFVLIKSGRDAGKTIFGGQAIIILSSLYPKKDIVVARDSFSDLRDSTFQTLQALIDEYKLSKDFVPKLNPMRIVNIRTGTNIYFMGIGGADKHRTKSFMPKNNSIIAVLFEELQQVKNQENLEQAHATFRRFLDPEKGVFIHLYNPEPQNAHWLNIMWNIKKTDPDWLCIHPNYTDIAHYLNNVDLKEILKMKMLDEQRYNWLYLGETGGGFGSVYPQFKRDKHYLPFSEARKKFNANRIVGMIVGVDGAVTHDATTLIPMALFDNGQAAILDIFYHDPIVAGQKSSAELMPFITKWFTEIKIKYGLDANQVPILFKVDSAAQDLRRQLMWFVTSNNIQVETFNKPSIVEMVGIVQSTLSRNMIYVVDYGGYQDYVRSTWQKVDNPLAVQLENLIWNEKQTGYNPIIPNDASDGFTYAVVTYYKNPTNQYWIDKITKQDFYDLEIKNGGLTQ
jgi:PBSX family phage terminase large subunit